MTNQEAISVLNMIETHGSLSTYAKETAIKALEELELYKQGGLCLIPSDVYSQQCQELDELKEKNTPKKPYPPIVTVALGSCGVCNTALFAKHKYCHNCGQATDWEKPADAKQLEEER